MNSISQTKNSLGMVISGVNGRASRVLMKPKPSQEDLGLPPKIKKDVEKAKCYNCEKFVDVISLKNHEIVCLRRNKKSI